MFTLQQVEDAHAVVKSGADFPGYIQAIKALGVRSFEHQVQDGRIRYHGSGEYSITSDPAYDLLTISHQSNGAELAAALRVHQQGGTGYPTFCRQSADAGVEKWVVDTDRMTCSYYDTQGYELLVETIPGR